MKKLMKIAFVAVFAAVTGYGVYASQKSEVLSDLMLANIEALANDESSANCFPTICDKDCRVGRYVYSYQSNEDCSCSLCTGN